MKQDRSLLGLWIVLGIVPIAGCWKESDNEVVVYSALDAEFSEPILQQYARERDVTVLPKFDIESTKTVGLVTRLEREQRRPLCDVFWNNEIMHTLRLERAGLLEAYISPVGAKYPANYRSSDGYWYGMAARARVLIVNTDVVGERERPTSIHDLVDAKWKGKVGIAKPLFGTTATHASVLFARWGRERAEEFFRQLKENAQVMSGNKQVAVAVAHGELAFGLTDTDDAIIEVEQGRRVTLVYPDQGEGKMGTLFIPNTLCIINDCPHPQQARALVNYLLSPVVERALAEGPSAQFPVNPAVHEHSRAEPAEPVRWMDVDFRAAAAQWETASTFLRELFASAQ